MKSIIVGIVLVLAGFLGIASIAYVVSHIEPIPVQGKIQGVTGNVVAQAPLTQNASNQEEDTIDITEDSFEDNSLDEMENFSDSFEGSGEFGSDSDDDFEIDIGPEEDSEEDIVMSDEDEPSFGNQSSQEDDEIIDIPELNNSIPSLAQAYRDPAFGTIIRKVTESFPEPSGSDIYSKNGFWNANNTWIMHTANQQGLRTIIDASTGTLVYSPILGNSEGSFDPINPHIWYYFIDTTLFALNVSSGNKTVLKVFPAPLGPLGGSVDWIDRTGRYMVLNVGGFARVWDKQTDSLYTSQVAVDPFGTGGWVGISPDGNYVIYAASRKQTSYVINHTNKSVSPQGTIYWTLCGEHADVISTSDGKTYGIAFECHEEAAVYRVDVTKQQSQQTQAGVDKQQADNVKLFDLDWPESGHFSCASRGAYQDWCFASITSDGNVSNYSNQVLAVHMLPPFEVMHLAHHRSEEIELSYYYHPRVDASWDGTKIAWASNFGHLEEDYADIYVADVNLTR